MRQELLVFVCHGREAQIHELQFFVSIEEFKQFSNNCRILRIVAIYRLYNTNEAIMFNLFTFVVRPAAPS